MTDSPWTRAMLHGAARLGALRILSLRHRQPEADAKYIQPLDLIPGMTAAPEPCQLLGVWSEALHPARAVAQLKIDGIRALYISTRIITREALPLDCAIHCLPALHALEASYDEPMVFDGEYAEPEGFQATLAAHKRGEGAGTFYVFDAVPLREWKANVFTQRCDLRVWELVRKARAVASPFLEPLDILPAESADQVLGMAADYWMRGYEGLVIKRAAGKYIRGRSNEWLKLKQRQTVDGKISDLVVDGDRVKAMLVRLATGKVARVGSGIPDEMRLEMAIAPDHWTGQAVEIGFSDTTDSGALRGAYLVRVRSDLGGK